MRIEKTRSTSGREAASKARRSGDANAFQASMKPVASVAPANPAAAASSVNSVAALMALQAVDDPLEKRKRAERRGRQLLDALDSLKLDMLEDRDHQGTLLRLKNILETAREDSGDSELDALIDQVELRAEVELAKLSRRR